MKCEKCKKEFTGQLYDGYCRFCAREESAVALSDGLDGPMDNGWPAKAEKFILDYTASTKWEQIENIDWTTAEVIVLMAIFARKEKAI